MSDDDDRQDPDETCDDDKTSTIVMYGEHDVRVVWRGKWGGPKE